MLQKIFRSGNSLAITLPSRLVKSLGLKAGEHVNLKINFMKKTVSLSFPDSGQMTLLSLSK